MPRRSIAPRKLGWMLAALAAGILLCQALPAQEPPAAPQPAPQPAPTPLHERIDALLESTSLGPRAPLAADADFLRRVYLDLNGTIPDAATARAFLDDASPGKREALVNQLVERPQFARHMARVFDVMWMERRAEKNVPTLEWQEYLRQGFVAGKTLDQLVREILSADGVDPAQRPAARFYLDRDGDPNLVARDVGRLFFGRDMQCAQCHDHPLVSDYLQADYYGMLAFVSRGELFVDTKATKSYYAEKAEGEVNYKSVFTGDARDHVIPKLPDGAALSEPALKSDEQYVIAPAKDVRPVPKYSRRAQLAAAATSGKSEAFNRNLANRLWAVMLGRGLVHPLDMQHSANPAVQSQLLALLTEELVRLKFDAKAFLREVALSRAYQRSSESMIPQDGLPDIAALAPALDAWRAELTRLESELKPLEEASNKAHAELATAYEAFSKSAAARDAALKAHGEAKKASDEVSAALAAAIKDVAAKDDILKALTEARDKAQAAVAKLPDDKPLVEAAGQFKTRTAEVEAQLAAGRKTVSEKTPLGQTAALKLGEAEAAWQTAGAAVTAAKPPLDVAEAADRLAAQKFRAAKARKRELEASLADAQALTTYTALQAAVQASQAAVQSATEQVAVLKSQTATAEQTAQAETAAKAASDKLASDRAAADTAYAALVDRSTVRFTLGALKPLSPEQLSYATMQALGVADAERAALEPQVKKDIEAQAGIAAEARPLEEQRLLEARLDEKLRGNIPPFVALFGQQPGQAAEFNATVHQALFFSNGGLLAGWLNPGGNNLTERLAKMSEPAAVADELYLTVLTRRPTADEQAAVAGYWQAGQADRAAAAREMVWSLVTSAEFRFNH